MGVNHPLPVETVIAKKSNDKDKEIILKCDWNRATNEFIYKTLEIIESTTKNYERVNYNVKQSRIDSLIGSGNWEIEYDPRKRIDVDKYK